MTMRVIVENTDQSRTMRVLVRLRNQVPGGEMLIDPAYTKEVEPGGKTDVWLHDGKDCVLEEVQPEAK